MVFAWRGLRGLSAMIAVLAVLALSDAAWSQSATVPGYADTMTAQAQPASKASLWDRVVSATGSGLMDVATSGFVSGNSGAATAKAANDPGANIDLSKYSSLLSFSNRCWSCDFVGKFVQIADVVAKTIFFIFKDDMKHLVTIGFSIWILIQGISLFFPDMAGSPVGIFRNIITRSFIFSAVLLALGGTSTQGNFFYEWVYNPAFETSSDAANAVYTKVVELLPVESLPQGGGGDQCGWFEEVNFPGSVAYQTIQVSTIQKLTCQVENMQRLNSVGFLVGWNSFAQKPFKFGELGNWLLTAFSAILLMYIFGRAMLTFPFYFVSLVYNITIVAAFAPFTIPGVVFSWSRGFLVSSIKMIFAAGLQMVGASIVYAFGAGMMGFVPRLMKFGNGNAATSLTDMMRLISENGVSFTFTDAAYWFMVFTGIFMIAMTGKIGGTIQQIFGISGGENSLYDKAAGIGGQVAGTAAKMAGTAVGLGAFASGAAAIGGGVGVGKAVAGGLSAGGVAKGAITGGMGGVQSVGRAAWNIFKYKKFHTVTVDQKNASAGAEGDATDS